MKVLVATEKPFAAAAVEGIKKEIEGAGNELVLLEKYTDNFECFEEIERLIDYCRFVSCLLYYDSSTCYI